MTRSRNIRHDPPHNDGLPEKPKVCYCTQANIGSEYSDEQREFILAVERYKRTRRRPFPALTEILAIAVSLGYRRDGGAVADSAKHSILPQI